MFRFPFYGYQYNYPYYKNFNNHINQGKLEPEKNENSITNTEHISNTTYSKFNKATEKAIFEMFGIELYTDDLIIICLLFFLYQQNVKDEMLYIILFLLLFS